MKKIVRAVVALAFVVMVATTPVSTLASYDCDDTAAVQPFGWIAGPAVPKPVEGGQ